MTAVSLPCTNCCVCNAIHDICIRCNIYFDAGDTVSLFGLAINNSDIQFLSNHAVNYRIITPNGNTFVGTAPTSGDQIQITLKRSGADCTNCSGDFYSDDFSGVLDPGWAVLAGGSPHLAWSTSGGKLVATISAGGANAGDLNRIYLCESDAATYTAKFCLNGSVVHTETISGYVLGPSISGIHTIYGGLYYDTSSGAPPTPASYDNFFMDLDT